MGELITNSSIQVGPKFDPEQRKLMLQLARNAISSYLKTESETLSLNHDFLQEPFAVFVTLRKNGFLRGCIGAIEAVHPLGETIIKCAVSSAFTDPRFPPLKAEELNQIHLEISILSSFREPQCVEEILAGTHGVMIECQNHRGLLLPQVAVEQGWDRETFLRHVSIKAGLSPDMWNHPDAKLHVFTAEIFAEEA
jgi:uncharacterized protein